jgi:hypothetical protein
MWIGNVSPIDVGFLGFGETVKTLEVKVQLLLELLQGNRADLMQLKTIVN